MAEQPDVTRFLPSLAQQDLAHFDDRERQRLELVNQRVAASPDLRTLLDFVFDTTHDLVPTDRLSLAFIEEEGQRVTARYSRAVYEPIRLGEGYSEDLHGSTLETILSRNTPRVIDDLRAYLQVKPQSRATRLLVEEGMGCSMSCPLRVDDRIVGFLFRNSRTPYAYSDHHVALHQAMAERLSQAVEKAWRIEQLEAANRNYLEVLGFVAHELKSPIAGIVTDLSLITDGYMGDVPDKQHAKLERSIKKAHHLLGLVREYLDLSRLEAGTLSLHPRDDVDVEQEILQPAIDICDAQLREKEIDLHVDLPTPCPPISADVELLKIVVINLLSNAIKYGRQNGVVRISLAPTDTGISLAVWNEGPGFPPQERSRLFKKFGRLQVPELLRQRGTGIGLYTVWRIVTLHHGHIDADSEPGGWAQFTVSLPQPIPTQESMS